MVSLQVIPLCGATKVSDGLDLIHGVDTWSSVQNKHIFRLNIRPLTSMLIVRPLDTRVRDSATYSETFLFIRPQDLT
jgi:hypothetical protein